MKKDEFIFKLRKDTVDIRDFKLTKSLKPVLGVKLPQQCDLRAEYPKIFNQGLLGSCTANAGVAALEMLIFDVNLNLSRLFLYYKERELNDAVSIDNGASMRDICKALQKFGTCEENLMPYVEKDFAISPKVEAIKNALKYKITSYEACYNINDIRNSIALLRTPVLLGMEVYNSIGKINKSAVLKEPTISSGDFLLGYHAVLVVGYDNKKKQLLIRNSWGDKWGEGGYFYMPYAYFYKYTFDYWTIRKST